MPNSLAGLLILAFAILPGVPGDKLYRLLVGYDWREDHWQRALRLLGFSVFGLALYSAVAVIAHLPPPAYLSLSALQDSVGSSGGLSLLFAALLGHFVAAAVAGLGAAGVIRGLGRTGVSVFAGSWDHFVFRCVPRHWVIVSLKSGESYAGALEAADTSVAPGERDVVLQTPAKYDVTSRQYQALDYQHLFLPGDLVASVAALHEPRIDETIAPVSKGTATEA